MSSLLSCKADTRNSGRKINKSARFESSVYFLLFFDFRAAGKFESRVSRTDEQLFTGCRSAVLVIHCSANSPVYRSTAHWSTEALV
jgi:hypothetical protein